MDWCRPAYGSRSFDLLPGTIERLLTGETDRPVLEAGVLDGIGAERFERVVFVYLDAFGWRFVEAHGDHPLLERARAGGVLAKLTSQFPSTTAAHVTTIHSGLPVGEHGVYEWHVYEPLLDRMITPLLYSYAGDRERGTLALPATDVFPAETLYMRLAEAGVAAHVVHPAVHAETPPNAVFARVATPLPFERLEQGLAALSDALATPGYGMIYLDDIDTLCHRVGPDDPAVAAAVDATLTLLDRTLFGGEFPPGTLVLLSADHGMLPVDPAGTLYVNRLWPGIAEHLRHGADGKPLAPGGSCRDLFLYARDGSVDEVVGRLGEALEGRAEVHAVSELLDDGIFGARPSERLLQRLGNVLVLPNVGEAVYWFEAGRFEQRLRGQHGGLSPQEMEIPLLALVT
ncbi:MAG: alkaline phosphatase family protein [Gaiellaceae bacterium]